MTKPKAAADRVGETATRTADGKFKPGCGGRPRGATKLTSQIMHHLRKKKWRDKFGGDPAAIEAALIRLREKLKA
jgi:hypothetical protein